MAARSTQGETLSAIVRAELPRMYRVAFRLTGDATRAEDLVALTLLNATKGWATFDGAHPSAWLLRILSNAHVRANQNEDKHRHAALDEVTEMPSKDNVEKEVQQRIAMNSLLEAMEKLEPEHQMVLTLCDIEQMTYDEVAVALDVPRGTVASRLYRARRALESTCRNVLEAIR